MLPRRMLLLLLITAPCMFCPVSAQTSLQTPPIIPYGLPITIENAKLAATAAVAEARSHKWAMAIAIVDPAGMLVYFEKMTDAQNAGVELSLEKARTSALFRRPTRLFQEALAAGGDNLRVLGLTGDAECGWDSHRGQWQAHRGDWGLRWQRRPRCSSCPERSRSGEVKLARKMRKLGPGFGGGWMRTSGECSEKAAEIESAADACHDVAIAAAYKKLAVSWRHVARQAAWQDDFLARETVLN